MIRTEYQYCRALQCTGTSASLCPLLQRFPIANFNNTLAGCSRVAPREIKQTLVSSLHSSLSRSHEGPPSSPPPPLWLPREQQAETPIGTQTRSSGRQPERDANLNSAIFSLPCQCLTLSPKLGEEIKLGCYETGCTVGLEWRCGCFESPRSSWLWWCNVSDRCVLGLVVCADLP